MMLERFDTNGDGKITKEEFETQRNERFASMDKNGDGQISLDEFQSAPPPQPSPARMEQMFKRADTNGDGVISKDELENRGDMRFDRLDKNGDGVVTAEEIKQAMPGKRGGRGPGDCPPPADGTTDAPK
ncbi:MAG: EF-hand domain-containing protein [Rhodospirillales bacterium]|nr:EF-hand domain-containing protein [Rhodospirillales bacterium]